MIINTERGHAGKTKINFKTSVSLSQTNHKLDFLNAKEYAQLKNQNYALRGLNKPFTADEISSFSKGTDWQDEVLDPSALGQKYELSFSGGTDKIRYFLGGGTNFQNGIVAGSRFNRSSLRANLDDDINSRLKISASLSGSYTNRSALPTSTKGYGNYPSVIIAMYDAPPTIPTMKNGALADFNNYKLGSGLANPLNIEQNYVNNQKGNRFLGTVYGQYNFTDGLYLKVKLGTNIYDFRNGIYYPIGSQASGGRGGVAQKLNTHKVGILNENTLHYKTTINGHHQIKALVGFTFQRQSFDNSTEEGWGFPSDYYTFNNIGLAQNPQAPESNASKSTLLSYIGRLNYILNDKYLATATIRADGSSRFGINNKYGVFPSGALAWRISQEPFLKNINAISQMKLRVSYGLTGNDAIGEYNSLATITTAKDISAGGNAYDLGGSLVPIAAPTNFANPDLSWEKTHEYDIGLDMGFVNNRLNINADYYHKKTTDLLLSVPLPTQSGYSTELKNIGSIRNEGFDLNIKSYNITEKTIDWTTNLNLSVNRNKVQSLGGSTSYIGTGWVGGGHNSYNGSHVSRLTPGQPIGEFYGFTWLGTWHSQEEIDDAGTMPTARPGDFRFKDTNGDGTISGDDLRPIGNPNPDFTFGITNDFSFKQWNLHVFLNGSYGNKVINVNYEDLLAKDGSHGVSVPARWTPDHPDRNGLGVASSWTDAVSTYNVEDGSYINIKDLRLSYQFGHLSTIDNLKVFLSVEDLFTITSYDGYNPQVNSYGYSNVAKGIDLGSYPTARSFRIGANITF